MNLDEMLLAAINDESLRNDFLQTLLDSEIFVIGQKIVTNRRDGTPIDGLNLMGINFEEGKKAQIFFTSMDMVKKCFGEEEMPVLAVKCRDFFKMTIGSVAVLNPKCNCTKLFSPAEIMGLLGVAASDYEGDINLSDTEVRVEQYKREDLPLDMVYELKKFFDDDGSVNSAYVGKIFSRHTRPHPLFIIDFDGDRDTLFPKIGDVIRPYFVNEVDGVEILDAKSEMAPKLIPGMTSFYKRIIMEF